MKNFLFLIGLLLLGSSALVYSQSKKSDCFSPENVTSDTYPQVAFTPEEMSPEIRALLQQSYTFLGSGNQCYAFESQDGSTVLKLIKFHCLRGEQNASRLKRIFTGMSTANSYNKGHCGLIYSHLYPTKNLNLFLSIQDKAGRKYLLESDQLVFMLQAKGIPTGKVLSQHLKKGEIESAKSKLEALFRMFADELEAGVHDQDHNIIHNTGFIGERPFRIDFGKLTLNPEMQDPNRKQKELKKLLEERIIPWFNSYYPAYAEEIQRSLQINR